MSSKSTAAAPVASAVMHRAAHTRMPTKGHQRRPAGRQAGSTEAAIETRTRGKQTKQEEAGYRDKEGHKRGREEGSESPIGRRATKSRKWRLALTGMEPPVDSLFLFFFSVPFATSRCSPLPICTKSFSPYHTSVASVVLRLLFFAFLPTCIPAWLPGCLFRSTWPPNLTPCLSPLPLHHNCCR